MLIISKHSIGALALAVAVAVDADHQTTTIIMAAVIMAVVLPQ